MSNDTAECGCEGHVENFDACKYPALLERVRRLEEALMDISTRCETKELRTTYAPDDANLSHKALEVIDGVWAAAREAVK